MGWLVWPFLAFSLTGCFLAGLAPSDQGITLSLCWLKLRYSLSLWDYTLAILGGLIAIVFHILAGFFRVMAFAHGVLMILSERAAEMIGLALPTYPNETKELEE